MKETRRSQSFDGCPTHRIGLIQDVLNREEQFQVLTNRPANHQIKYPIPPNFRVF